MDKDLTIEQKRLILDAGFDSDKRAALELYCPSLSIYLLDKVKFEQIWQQVLEYDNEGEE